METGQASQPKAPIPNGKDGYAIPERFHKAPLFHTNRKRERERLLKGSRHESTASPANSKSTPPTPSRPKPRPKPKVVKVEDDDTKSSAFTGPFQEFKLMSSSLNGWRYDVMKLESRKPIEVESWQHPLKLNRKEPKKGWETNEIVVGAPQAVGPMLGPDGKPVVGADGKLVMVDAEGRPIHANSAEASSSKPSKEKAIGGRKKFQKKTKQVYLVPEATRLLRKEERYPWVLEDSSGSQVWVGMLEDLGKAETHAMFLPTSDNVFKFVPPHRWYKFQKKPNYRIRSLEEAEKLMAQYAKQKNPEQWLAHRTKAGADSNGIKSEEIANPHIPATVSLVHSSSQGLGPGGRKLKSVDSGMNGLFGDNDDDDEVNFKRKREREFGADGDGDEIDFEEDFADDEEKNPDEVEDEEAKELEERIKKEYRKANNTQDANDSDEDDQPQLTGAGKAIQKVLKKTDKSGQYDESDDDERNPYASSEDEEEEEPDATQMWTGPAIQAPPPRANALPVPAPAVTASGVINKPSLPSVGPRATSPTLGGHSVVAKRATSPKVPKGPKTSRAGSPLASRAISPPSDINSPGSPISPGAMPSKSNSNKRKAEDESNTAGKTKKRKGSGGTAVGELDDKMVIEWLRNTPNATTRDCILHFTRYLTDETKKMRFTALIKDVAQLRGGVLVLRNAYRDASPNAE